MADAGAMYDTCAQAPCWNDPTDHGWTMAQDYHVFWGAVADLAWPEIYNSGWPTYYYDMSRAAKAVGKHKPYYEITWACNTGGDVSSPSEAWADFVTNGHQRTEWVTRISDTSAGVGC